MQLLAFPDSEAQGRALARRLAVPVSVIDVHRFPDGESRLRLPAELPDEVVLLRSLDDPDRKLVQLLLAARAVRAGGARRVDVLVTHALLVDDARALLTDAGVDELWSSDSIPDASNAFPLADLLASALQ